MDSEEKNNESTPIQLNTNTISDDQNQKDNTLNIQTENNPQNETRMTKAEKFEMINKIFLSNSSFNKHTKEYFITRFQIILILKKSNIINDEIISKTQADILLTKLKPNHNKYKFIDFMNYLTEICKYIFKENFNKNPKKYMSKFFDYLINNYYEYFEAKLLSNYIDTETENNCTINSIKKIIETDIEKHALKLLVSMYSQLKKIYSCYFKYELDKKYSKETIMLNSMENFITFAKDFEIMPYLINEKNLVTYYNLLLRFQRDYTETIKDLFLSIKMDENKNFQDIGTCFKLSTFLLFLYHFSFLLYYKKFKVQFSMYKMDKPVDIEILLFFLQKLEHSNGISKYILRKQRTNEDKFTFVPSNENIELALKELSDDKYEGKPILTSINDYNFNFTNSVSPNGISGINSPMNNLMLNTNISYDNNILETRSDINNIIKSPETTKNKHKGEEICKNSKNINELINKRLIKELNSTSVNLDNSINLRSARSARKQKNNIMKSKTVNNETKENIKYSIELPSILDFENFLNVNSEIVNLISEKIESLNEVFLKYSKMNDKLEFNRMSFSSFLFFLKDSNMLIGIPKELKEKFRKVGEKLMQKSVNVSEIKTYSKKFKGSVPCQNTVLTQAEKFYKYKISQIVNAKSADFEEQISIGEAAVIFNTLTNSKNFPIYTESIKLQFDKNSGINLNVGDNLSKTRIFDKKLFLDNQQNVPGKMDFMLFIKSFELIAAKLYPDQTLNTAVKQVLEQKIFPILPKVNIISANKLTEVMDKLNNKNIKYFMKELSPVMYPIYQQFADINNKMKFSNFLDFFTKFELFPELISLTQIKIIFFTLNESSRIFNLNTTNNNMTMNTEYKNTHIQVERLDYNKFLEALAITAMIFNYKNIVNDIDRLIYLCYQIYNAKPIREDKLGGITSSQANKNLGKFLKGFIKRYKNEEEKNENEDKKIIKEKKYINDKEIKEQLDLQFDFDEDKKNEQIYNSFF